MKWMKERDLLIAQTMAFVQSVTGKKPDADLLMAAPKTEKSTTETPAIAPMPTPAITSVVEAALAETTLVVEPANVGLPPSFVKLDIRGDFQSEVRARVATFRANQQRFLKEREEYCSSTMAKVRASLRENQPPRLGE
jgi:hypothetical protein